MDVESLARQCILQNTVPMLGSLESTSWSFNFLEMDEDNLAIALCLSLAGEVSKVNVPSNFCERAG